MNPVAIILVTFAVTLLFVIPVGGALLFRPQRARNVKHAERDQSVIEHVVEVRRYHPEIVKVSRLDRHPAFIVPHACVLGYSVCVFSGSKLTSNVLSLGDSARYTMATCFAVGSLIVLTGIALGGRVGKWRLARSVHDHLTSSILGDDVVLPYRIEIAGMGAMTVSSAIYSWTSFQSTAGSLGGWLTGGLAVACVLMIISLFRATKVFEKWDHTLISEARARIGDGDRREAD